MNSKEKEHWLEAMREEMNLNESDKETFYEIRICDNLQNCRNVYSTWKKNKIILLDK